MVKISTKTGFKGLDGLRIKIILRCVVLFTIAFTVGIMWYDLESTNIKDFPVEPSSESNVANSSLTTSSLLRIHGDGWKIVDWNEAHEKSRYICDWKLFNSTTGKTAQMCVHPFKDIVSGSVRRIGRWKDCDTLTNYWAKGIDNGKSIYVEIGANIGTCVMEMLLSTDANIIAFEPHPRNLFCLRSTISKLSSEYQERVTLFPIALGDKKGVSTIYSARGNMGNSVVGTKIRDFDSQVFDEAEQTDIHLERLDSVFSTNIDVKLMKIDAQGFECNILEGMGTNIGKKIQQIKFEWAKKWLDNQNCTDLLPKFRSFGFVIYGGRRIFTGDYQPEKLTDLYATRIDL